MHFKYSNIFKNYLVPSNLPAKEVARRDTTANFTLGLLQELTDSIGDWFELNT